jgi:hypothetical protein
LKRLTEQPQERRGQRARAPFQGVNSEVLSVHTCGITTSLQIAILHDVSISMKLIDVPFNTWKFQLCIESPRDGHVPTNMVAQPASPITCSLVLHQPFFGSGTQHIQLSNNIQNFK